MKSKVILGLGCALLAVLALSGCKKEKEEIAVTVVEAPDLINDDFPEAKAEVMAVMEELKLAINDGNIDKLISFHAYGPKFTEFKNGEPRNGGTENEAFERGTFGNVTAVEKFEYDDLEIAVYDNVANVTFHSDFVLKFGDDTATVKDQISLVMVRTENGWKIAHEHHSPLKI